MVDLRRRALLKNGTLVMAAAGIDASMSRELVASEEKSALRIGLVTDLHYADKPAAGSRHYRQSLDKLAEAAARFRDADLALLVELGDLIDAADTVQLETEYLDRVNHDFSAICPRRHYVLGNHCVYSLTKREFLDGVGQERSYYSFDAGSFHFILLDACFRSDGRPYGRQNFEWTDANIPAGQFRWLEADLRAATTQTIVFVHQRLDVRNNYGIRNAAEVRRLLEDSGKVLAVFQGHSHQNDYRDLRGIHYCTLVAMVEGSGAAENGYAILHLADNGTLSVEGFRRQHDYQWQVRRPG